MVKDSVLDTFGGEADKASDDKVASPKAFLEGKKRDGGVGLLLLQTPWADNLTSTHPPAMRPPCPPVLSATLLEMRQTCPFVV